MLTVQTLLGKRIGTLTVLERTKNERGDQARFICRCACGKIHIRFASELIAGNVGLCECKTADGGEHNADFND